MINEKYKSKLMVNITSYKIRIEKKKKKKKNN